MTLLEARGLHAYYGESHVLHGIDLTIREGEAVALLGRNGMGKTTTVRGLCGLLAPRRGSIRLAGEDVTAAPPFRRARLGLGLAPEGRGIFPNLTVAETLAVAARPGGTWTTGAVLDLFPRLKERLRHPAGKLSGGEQQMLAIGRALTTHPRLLILDEATEGLAPLVREEIWAVLRRLRSAGLSVLVIDKDLETLLSLADRCVILEKGRVAWEGSAADLAARPDIHLKYLGV
jgi:branched-chain amino acid transport system ATP-binding protein